MKLIKTFHRNASIEKQKTKFIQLKTKQLIA